MREGKVKDEDAHVFEHFNQSRIELASFVLVVRERTMRIMTRHTPCPPGVEPHRLSYRRFRQAHGPSPDSVRLCLVVVVVNS